MNPQPLAVLDTNVIVSAQLSPFGAPGRIWDLALARLLRVAYDDRLLLEYETVLRRPKFAFPPALVEALMAVFVFQEAVQPLPWPYQPLPDPKVSESRPCSQLSACYRQCAPLPGIRPR